jgi:hypothetical protein
MNNHAAASLVPGFRFFAVLPGIIDDEPAFPESPPNRTCGEYTRID